MENATFVLCPKCGHPMMDDWHECPYCKIKVDGHLEKSSLLIHVFIVLIAVVLFSVSILSFLIIDWGKQSKSRESRSVQQCLSTLLFDDNKEEDINSIPIVIENDDGDYESLDDCYKYVKNHSGEITSKMYRYAKCLLEKGIAENVRSLSRVSKEDQLSIRNGLVYFASQMPANGYILKSSDNYGQSPLRIYTDGDDGYVVKLFNVNTKRTERLLFIPEYWKYEIEVPDGEYEIRYKTGSKWYGDKILFGNKCNCARADRTFLFHNGQGFSITLRKVKDGNLRTEEMNMEDF